MSSLATGLGARAHVLLYAVVGGGAAIVAWAVLHLHASGHTWLVFALLGFGAALAQLFQVHTPRNNAFSMSVAFTLAAVFLLPLPLVALLPIVQLLPEWLRDRHPWYQVAFNVGNHTIDLYAAYVVVDAIGWPDDGHGARWALAGLAAATMYTLLNHGILAAMLREAKGHTIRSTGLLGFDSLANELVLALVGFAVASFWKADPWLVALALAPLLLIHRSLAVAQLQEEARVDPKTGLFNARHFASSLAAELTRAKRFERPLSLLMVDLDHLRDVNNTYGHLAGDAVLRGVADVFRAQLRHFDVPARFGGEEFAILLPETDPEQAIEIAERIRRQVASDRFDVATSESPIQATVSIGVAGYPRDGADANELVHEADLAVYRAKLQGRNRVLGASREPLELAPIRRQRLEAVPHDAVAPVTASPTERPRSRAHATPRLLSLSPRLALLVGAVSLAGIGAGIAGLLFGGGHDGFGIAAIILLVAAGQALALEYEDAETSISVSAVGALAGASLFGPRVALGLALTIAVVEWSARRTSLHQVLFNVGSLTLACLAASEIFALVRDLHGTTLELVLVAAGLVAGAAYFAVNTGLVALVLAVETREDWRGIFRSRFAWLLPHYVGYGFVGAVMAIAYEAVGMIGLVAFAVPLLLMRTTQEAYLSHTQRSSQKLREAAETIQSQNVSLEQANRLLRERSTAAMESLSSTIDARDAFAHGHSRRVQRLALAIGRELDLSQPELDLLGHAALFHDIGKLAIPDAVLLKPSSLAPEEWALMRRHADEGARIIDRLGFLQDAVPAIRHHHERWDGTGYPDRLAGEEIPLGARIIHVADAVDSMLTSRVYRPAIEPDGVVAELRRGEGTQFCPRTIAALERILPLESVLDEVPAPTPPRLQVLEPLAS
jgi:diguanylate cyclase (GGDEF)-like protein/putative nucleotidyltransferase with HDIG domain